MPKSSRPIIALGLFCALPWPAQAQPAHPCGAELEPAQRLACYDRAFPPSAAVVDATARAAEHQFGLDPQPTPRKPGSEAAASLDSRVVRLDEDRHGQRIITLANGQVWQGDGSQGLLSEGDAISLRKAALGSHMLVTPAGVRLRVTRLR